MKYLIIVKATEESEAGTPPDEALIARMADYHEELARAGVLLDASGLRPSSAGWRVRYAGGNREIVDGPIDRTDALVAGYTLIQVRSREEAREWTRRFPNPRGPDLPAEIEVRPLMELDDFPPSKAVERFRRLDSDRTTP